MAQKAILTCTAITAGIMSTVGIAYITLGEQLTHIISSEPVEILAGQLEAFNGAAGRLGARSSDPMLTLVTLTGAAIPYLRICEEGLVNLKDDRTLGLFVE